jgi:integrase
MKIPNGNFVLKQPNLSSPTTIRFTSYIKGQKMTYSTGIKILPQLWDPGNQSPITASSAEIKNRMKHDDDPDLAEKRNILEEIIKEEKRNNPNLLSHLSTVVHALKKVRTTFEDSIHDLSLLNKPLNHITVKAEMSKRLKPDTQKSNIVKGFWERFDQFLEISEGQLKPLTIKKYKTLYTRLKAYEKKSKTKMTFDIINMNFYDDYMAYLLNIKNPRRNNERGLLDDTISKEFSSLKSFMRWSLERRYHSNNTFQLKSFSANKKNKQDQVTLKEAEVESLLKLDLTSNTRLEKVRDIFCFGIFTGQRWSDIEGFEKDQLKGHKWIFRSKKTGDIITVPLFGFSAPALDILKKYDFRLPLISQQKFNEYIKEVGKMADINELITIERLSGSKRVSRKGPKHEFMSSHMARRTFVTLLLEKNIPITTIRKITGHKDIQTLMRYENTGEEAVFEAFNSVSLFSGE